MVVVVGMTCEVGHRNLPYKANLKRYYMYTGHVSLVEMFIQFQFGFLLNSKVVVGLMVLWNLNLGYILRLCSEFWYFNSSLELLVSSYYFPQWWVNDTGWCIRDEDERSKVEAASLSSSSLSSLMGEWCRVTHAWWEEQDWSCVRDYIRYQREFRTTGGEDKCPGFSLVVTSPFWPLIGWELDRVGAGLRTGSVNWTICKGGRLEDRNPQKLKQEVRNTFCGRTLRLTLILWI